MPRRRDLAVAGVTAGVVAVSALGLVLLIAAGAAAGLTPPASAAAWWLGAAVFAAQAAALCWARVAPAAVIVGVTLLPVWLPAVGVGDLFSVTDVAVAVAAYVAAIRLRAYGLRWQLPLACVLVLVGHAANSVAESATWGVALAAAVPQALAVVGAPLLLAAAISGRRQAQTARRGEVLAVEREHDARVQAALADERAATARELHDIAAHHMSGIALMTAAISRQIDSDPLQAKRSLAEVRAESSRVLDDLRRVVGLLRDDGEEGLSAAESLSLVEDLIARRRAAGMAIELTVHPSAGADLGAGAGPLAQRAAYRIVQESLSNVAAHAPGQACTVEIDDRDARWLEVAVRNRLAPARSAAASVPRRGFGLLGMRERAQLVGGELSYGPSPDGYWEVRVSIPKEGPR